MTPTYLKDNLPPFRRFLYGDDHPLQYREIFCNTLRYKNSFFPDVIKTWNNIGHDFKNVNNILAFKKCLNALIRPKEKSTFRIFDPRGINYLFQMRVGLSPLKYYKKKYEFLDTPHDLCDCGSASEDNQHFLFHCSFYILQRASLINSISTVLVPYPTINLQDNTNLLLYGNDQLSFAENNQILQSTIKYIKDSLRFSS